MKSIKHRTKKLFIRYEKIVTIAIYASILAMVAFITLEITS